MFQCYITHADGKLINRKNVGPTILTGVEPQGKSSIHFIAVRTIIWVEQHCYLIVRTVENLATMFIGATESDKLIHCNKTQRGDTQWITLKAPPASLLF